MFQKTEYKKVHDWRIFIFLLFVVFASQSYSFSLPYYWDGHFFTAAADLIANRNLKPDYSGPYFNGKSGFDSGHFPLFFEIIAIGFKVSGYSITVSHLIAVAIAFLGVYFTYAFGALLYNKAVGLISAILMFMSPLYFAQSSLMHTDIAVAAFTVMAFYFLYRENIIGYWIAGSALMLSKEPALLILPAILLFLVLRYKSNVFQKGMVYSFPFIVAFAWLVYHYFQTGFFLYHHNIGTIAQGIFKFPIRLRIFFLDDFKWILTSMIVISFYGVKLKSYKRVIAAIFFGLFVYFLSINIDSIALAIEPLVHVGNDKINTAADAFKPYALFYALFALYAIGFSGGFNWKRWSLRKIAPIILMIIVSLMFFSYVLYMPRYLLLIYPLFFIISGRALALIFKTKLKYVAAGLIIFLFITSWFGTRDDELGYFLENNLEYLDVVKVHSQMAQFIEQNYPEARILTANPMVYELRYPFQGYVNSSLNVLSLNHYDLDTYSLKEGTYGILDWYYYECFLAKECYADPDRSHKKRNIDDYDNSYSQKLSKDTFDIYYFSPQSVSLYPKDRLRQIALGFNLKLVKRFESNGKYAELYISE